MKSLTQWSLLIGIVCGPRTPYHVRKPLFLNTMHIFPRYGLLQIIDPLQSRFPISARGQQIQWPFFELRYLPGSILLALPSSYYRVEIGEVSGHRGLIKRGPGNRGPTECGTTHEATSGMSSSADRNDSRRGRSRRYPAAWFVQSFSTLTGQNHHRTS